MEGGPLATVARGLTASQTVIHCNTVLSTLIKYSTEYSRLEALKRAQ